MARHLRISSLALATTTWVQSNGILRQSLINLWSDKVALTPTLSRNPRVKPGEERGRNPFSRLREKVAGDSRPDEFSFVCAPLDG